VIAAVAASYILVRMALGIYTHTVTKFGVCVHELVFAPVQDMRAVYTALRCKDGEHTVQLSILPSQTIVVLTIELNRRTGL
jgi:hypothetical protein